jgi:hypothetical protein
MPSSSGPNTVNDSIIFAYDTGDAANSYKGEPTINYWNGNQFSIYNDGATNIRNSTDIAPPIPGYEVVKVTANTIGSYGQCILWNATYPNNNVATITNSIYAYLTIGDYVQVGQHWFPWYYGTQQAITKYQWVRISETYTINEGNSYGNAALTYSTNGIAYFAMPQYEYKSHVTPFIGANQTRSTTQGLLDISGKSNTIDLVNMTYNAAALPVFDGTDDYTDVTSNLGTLNEYTIEHVSYKGSNDRMPIAFRGGPVFYQYGDNSWYYTHGGVSGEYYYPKSFTINGWGHWVIVYNGSFVRIYRNGVYEGQQATSGTANWTNGMRIGYWPYGGNYAWNGQIAIVKMYNRALSDTEVTNNYLAYKTRFNLS